MTEILRKEKEEEANKLTHSWMGTNLNQKGFNEVLDAIRGSKSGNTEEPSQEEIDQNWRKVAQLMGS